MTTQPERPRSRYLTVRISVDTNTVYLADRDDGAVSVTNDAENVVRWWNYYYPGIRVVYLDTMGEWGELQHRDGMFENFATWSGWTPPMRTGPATVLGR